MISVVGRLALGQVFLRVLWSCLRSADAQYPTLLLIRLSEGEAEKPEKRGSDVLLLVGQHWSEVVARSVHGHLKMSMILKRWNVGSG